MALLAQLRQAQHLGVLEQEQARALVLRVVVALDRVDVVGRHQLAPLPLEGRVVGEVDAGPDAKDEAAEVAADLRHGGRGLGLDAGRPRQVVVGQRRLEDVGRDRARVQVGDLGRVETGLRHGKRQ
jgi:hypothetical protein